MKKFLTELIDSELFYGLLFAIFIGGTLGTIANCSGDDTTIIRSHKPNVHVCEPCVPDTVFITIEGWIPPGQRDK